MTKAKTVEAVYIYIYIYIYIDNLTKTKIEDSRDRKNLLFCVIQN